jgi:hypothetical protein
MGNGSIHHDRGETLWEWKMGVPGVTITHSLIRDTQEEIAGFPVHPRSPGPGHWGRQYLDVRLSVNSMHSVVRAADQANEPYLEIPCSSRNVSEATIPHLPARRRNDSGRLASQCPSNQRAAMALWCPGIRS